MKAVHKARLLKLATHLETGKLGHEVFDFSIYHCGTKGCAIGECPTVFPGEWSVIKLLPVVSIHNDPEPSAIEFFGISSHEFDWLFLPALQGDEDSNPDDPAPWSSSILTDSATKYEVAASIRRFVAWKESQVTAIPIYAGFAVTLVIVALAAFNMGTRFADEYWKSKVDTLIALRERKS